MLVKKYEFDIVLEQSTLFWPINIIRMLRFLFGEARGRSQCPIPCHAIRRFQDFENDGRTQRQKKMLTTSAIFQLGEWYNLYFATDL